MKYLYIGDLKTVLEYTEDNHGGVRKEFSSVEEFRDVLELVRGVVFQTPLVLCDISALSFRMAYMLKFVETFTSDLIVVGSYDNILPTILSRFDVIKKFRVTDSFESPDSEQLKLKLFSDFKYIDNVHAMKTIETFYPSFMPFYLKTQKAKARRSVLSLATEFAGQV